MSLSLRLTSRWLSRFNNRTITRPIRTPLQSQTSIRSVVTISKHHGPLTVQRVRLRPRRITWKKLATWSLGLGLSLYLISTVLGTFIIEIDDTEDVGLVKDQIADAIEGEKLGASDEGDLDLEGKGHTADSHVRGEEEEDDEDDEIPDETPEGAWFIPLTFAKQMPPSYYSGDDPEWQSFVEFAKDKERQTQVKHELCSIILRSLKGSKGVMKIVGSDVKCRGYWLDVDYPYGPPPQYERYGIEWADDYIALLHRPVNATTVKRVEKALWPSAVTESAISTLKELLKQQYSQVKKDLGFEADSEPLSDNKKSQLSKTTKLSDDENATGKNSSTAQSSASANQQDKIVDLLSILPSYPQDNQRIRPGLVLFNRKLSKLWKPVHATPPPGSLFMTGLIEYRGSEATCTVEVVAIYLVAESRWHSVMVDLKRAQANVQHPRGKRPRSAG